MEKKEWGKEEEREGVRDGGTEGRREGKEREERSQVGRGLMPAIQESCTARSAPLFVEALRSLSLMTWWRQDHRAGKSRQGS